MPDGPSHVTFDDLIRRGVLEIGDGYRAKNSELGGDGPVFLRAGLVADSGIDLRGAERFSAELAGRVASKSSRLGDTIVTTKGNSTGRTAYIGFSTPSVVYSPHLSYWRSRDASKLDPRFLRYWARSDEFGDQLEGMSHSTDMAPYLSLADQRRLRITLPEPGEQTAIGELLGALDDKIDLNRRLNRTIEETVSALFRSWFVDFDPVVAKAAGRAPLGMDAATASLLPSAFEESEQGLIPRGWRVTKLRDFGVWRSGATPPRGASAAWAGDMPWISAKSMHNFCVQTSDEHVDPAASNGRAHLAPAGSTLFVVRGMSLADEFRVGIADRTVAFNQDLKAIVPNGAVEGLLIGLFLLDCRSDVLDLVDEAGHGTKKLETDRISALTLALPEPGIQARLVAPLKAQFDLMCANQTESRTLGAIRDALLPKLLSGEICLRDAERLAEAPLR